MEKNKEDYTLQDDKLLKLRNQENNCTCGITPGSVLNEKEKK